MKNEHPNSPCLGNPERTLIRITVSETKNYQDLPQWMPLTMAFGLARRLKRTNFPQVRNIRVPSIFQSLTTNRTEVKQFVHFDTGSIFLNILKKISRTNYFHQKCATVCPSNGISLVWNLFGVNIFCVHFYQGIKWISRSPPPKKHTPYYSLRRQKYILNPAGQIFLLLHCLLQNTRVPFTTFIYPLPAVTIVHVFISSCAACQNIKSYASFILHFSPSFSL